MITGLYSAATAMDAATRRHETAAANLANVQMPGYRRQVIANTTFDMISPPLQQTPDGVYSSKLLGTTTKPIIRDFTPGNVESTKRPLDLALSGDGFFTVQGPDGPLYTRNGSFYMNNDGQLVTIDNLPVLGNAGPLTVPQGVNPERIEIARDGRLYGNGEEFGQLEVVTFNNLNELTPTGSSLFSAPPTTNPVASDAEVMQGYRELANTSSIDELISLITGTRHFEAAQKAMTTIAESVQKRIGLR